MKLKTLVISCAAAGLLLGASARAAEAVDAKAAFERIKALAGNWQGSFGGDAANDATVEYRVTGGGSTVMETLGAGTPHEMVSMIHLDGGELVLTHYCAGGNQPRLRLDRAASTPDHLKFVFVDGTNMDPAKDSHIHQIEMRLLGDDKLSNTAVSYTGGKQDHAMVFDFTRKKG